LNRPLNIGTDKALQKIKHFCAYQERNHREVKEKLYGYGLYKTQVEELLSLLIEENFLNEERYAITFSGGKFRMKGWGKNKIKYALRQQQVSEYCIRMGMNSINEEEYEKKLEQLFDQKLKTLKAEKNIFIKKRKLQDFLMQRGFETSLINKLLKDV
jgi:regulatory protein